MIKELMHDPIFLACKSEEATKEDITIANDLLETLMAHKERILFATSLQLWNSWQRFEKLIYLIYKTSSLKRGNYGNSKSSRW